MYTLQKYTTLGCIKCIKRLVIYFQALTRKYKINIKKALDLNTFLFEPARKNISQLSQAVSRCVYIRTISRLVRIDCEEQKQCSKSVFSISQFQNDAKAGKYPRCLTSTY